MQFSTEVARVLEEVGETPSIVWQTPLKRSVPPPIQQAVMNQTRSENE